MTPLSPTEARVLATLMEKARTVPDSYPLSLNALVSGCNQKSSREPLTSYTDSEVQEALESLRRRSLVFESSGNRVPRWEHNFQRVIGVPEQSAALLALLMLRGPQTAGELRIHSERWHRFADISSVEAFLDELASRPADQGGPLVVQLARAAGAREARWAQLLCGPVEAAAPVPAGASAAVPAGLPPSDNMLLMTRVALLEMEVAVLRATVHDMGARLGLSPPGHPESNDRA